MAELVDALGKGKTLTFAGRDWTVRPLDFNDLCDLEESLGTLEALDLSTLKHQREVLWLTLRKADPTLPDEYRQRGQYKLTRQDVGAMLTAEELQKPETGEFLIEVLRMSGILPRKPEGDASPKPPAETTPHSGGESEGTSIS